jgi:DNA repair protein RadA/Sms
VATAKTKSFYSCQQCGHRSNRWLGRCPACSAWNSFSEEVETAKSPRALTTAGRPAAEAVPLDSVDTDREGARVMTGIGELDRVLGGGLVAGSAVLLGGDPGIGKSTLSLELAAAVAKGNRSVVYVAGEEAPAQIRLRAERLGAATTNVLVLAATSTTDIAAALVKHEPALAIIDSVQTVYTQRVESAPGSVSQLREASAELVTVARECGSTLLLIGHVTKEGYLAGPRVLEHLVDTVLYFEGDKNYVFRILRAVKNRFGPAGEIGVFEMASDGLREVENPSAAFAGSDRKTAPGSVVSACVEGSRSLLVEIQALVAPSHPGSARRTALGIDPQRVAMLVAVMERKLGLAMISQDVFLNTVGGVRIDDPGVDLAIVAALASSYHNRPLPSDLAVIGEVGLTGEVRPVSQARARAREAARLGFGRLVVPSGSIEQIGAMSEVQIAGVASVEQAWEELAHS